DFFLPSRTRRKDITRSLSEKTSVKDVIESCGVPHPEVDLIVVNGEEVDFDYGVINDADIEVYAPEIQSPQFGKKRLQVHTIRRFTLLGLIAPFTRCLRCNAQLQETTKADIIEELEPLTKIYYEQFRRCTGCGQIYWPGSHFPKLQKRLEKIRANVGG